MPNNDQKRREDFENKFKEFLRKYYSQDILYYRSLSLEKIVSSPTTTTAAAAASFVKEECCDEEIAF